MRTALTLCAAALALATITAPTPARAMFVGEDWTPSPTQVATLVAPLEGEERLSQSVSTIFDFQIWQTLDPAVSGNRAALNGLIGWNDRWPTPVDTRSAISLARERSGQLIVWGRVQRYGDEVLALPRLSLAPTDSDIRRVRPEIWTITMGDQSVSLDVPRVTFNLGVVRLSREFVAGFSDPSALRLCRERGGVCDGPPVGHQFIALRQEGEWSRVILPHEGEGWVRVPPITKAPGMVGGFVGGMIAYFRGDFIHAGDQFEAALASGGLGPPEELDATALVVSARARSGRDTAALRGRMLELDPYSAYAAKVAVMERLEAAARAADPAVRRAVAKDAAALLEARADLFGASDPWPAAAKAVIERAEGSPATP